jgi:hypothetical protein
MKKSEEVLQWVQSVLSMETEVGIDGVGNVNQHIRALRKKVDDLTRELQEYQDISGCKNKARAKSHFRTLMRKEKSANDLTLIDELWHKVSSTWIDGVAKKGYIRAEAPMSYKRAELEHESLLPFIIRLHEMCKTREDGDDILSKFKKDYLTMGRTQFSSQVYKFVENIFDSQELEEEITLVQLCEAIPLCRGYFPQQLLDDFIEYDEELGTISVEWFQSVETAVASKGKQANDAAKRILTLSMHRASGNSGTPTFTEENIYQRLLSTEKDCPWGEEWIVQENTKLADLLEQILLEIAS